MSTPERNESIAEVLGALARNAADSHAFDEPAARAALLRRVAEDEPVRARPSRKWLALVPALAVACALFVWWKTPARLDYEVIGAAKNGSYVSAPAHQAATLQFTDATVIEVAAGSQLRVEETTRQGARVLLERGSTDVHVVHRDESRWSFVAGPFEVRVTGTRFDLKWDPAQEVLELSLREGSVEVQTPFSAAPVALRGGQHFRADLSRRSMTTTEGEAARLAPAAPAPSNGTANDAALDGTSPQGAPGAPLAPNLPSSGASPATRSWPKLIAAGQFDTLLAQANERGIAQCVKACTASDLRALADAARYKGRTDLADQSLRALRSRFAAEPEGRAAAFLLGRLQDRLGATGDARLWYERYLKETPGGAYAAEALAGKMSTTLKLEGQSAAAPIAREYLRRYPTGVHASTARGIVGAH